MSSSACKLSADDGAAKTITKIAMLHQTYQGNFMTACALFVAPARPGLARSAMAGQEIAHV
jgi:hypothetical protein